MTEQRETQGAPAPDMQPSTSRDLGLELLGLRLNGAQLGAMLGVSRQAVSGAVKRGTIAPPGSDGLFDARRAVREWMANTDPARVRARALKPGADAMHELRDRVQALTAEVAQVREELAEEREWGDRRELAAGLRAEMQADQQLCAFVAALQERFAEAVGARDAGSLPRWLDELVAVSFYGQDLEEFRASCSESEDGEQVGVGPA